MAINKAGGPNFQAQLNRATMNDARTIDAKEAGHAAQTGAAGKLAEKNKENKTTKTPGERVKLSSAAMLQQAKEAEEAQDATTQSQSNVADEAAVQNRGKRQLKGGVDDDEKKIGARDVKEKGESRVFPLDDESGEAYEVTETQGKKLDALDERTPQSILQGMPEGARNAAQATLDTQIKTKGTEKVSQLKNGPPEVNAAAEEMDLDLADPEWKKSAAKPAPIQLGNKPMEPEISSMDKDLAGEAVRRKMASGEADEAMIAS
jgi:hypothetical protein